MVATKKMTVGLYLLDRLHQLGVRHIFGIPGDYILRFDKIIEEHSIEFVNATRENTAGYMADAYARLHGLGVACITYGVGLNIANATSQAYVESSPMVIISGSASPKEMGPLHMLHHQINPVSAAGFDLTQMEILQKITVDQAILADPATAASDIERVLQACLFHRKPVYLEIPRDQVDAPIKGVNLSIPQPHSNPEALQEALQEVSQILRNSRNPVIWAGHELRRRQLAAPLLRFAEKWHIPILSTLLGKGVVDEHHPLFVGVYQGAMSVPEVKAFASRCDAALLLGLIHTDVDTGMFTAPLGPDGRIQCEPNRVTIGHHHFPDVLLSDFVEGLAKLEPSSTRTRDNVFPHCVDRQYPPFRPIPGAKTTSQRLFECIQSHLTADSLLVSDTGDCLFGAADLVIEQDGFLAGSLFASLGFGVPAALGAQFALPDKRVIAVVGDGAFQMTATELSTAVRYGLDPIIIVLNNHGYGMERTILEGTFNDITNWNYSEIARFLGGGFGIRVSTEEALEKAFVEAIERRGMFTLIEVELGKLDFSDGMQRLAALFAQGKNPPTR